MDGAPNGLLPSVAPTPACLVSFNNNVGGNPPRVSKPADIPSLRNAATAVSDPNTDCGEIIARITHRVAGDDGAHAPSGDTTSSDLCVVCHRFEPSLELGCGHDVCKWCAKMHGCGECGELILTRTPLHDDPDQHGAVIFDEAAYRRTPGNDPIDEDCVTSPLSIMSVTPEPVPDDADEEQHTSPCTICENRRQAARVTCKNMCEVFTCGSCASKHKKCFMCNAKVTKVEEVGDDEHMFSSRGMGCDVCSKRSRVLLLECRMGCQFRVCADCHDYTKQCCGYPVRSGGKIVAASAARQSIDWRSNATGGSGRKAPESRLSVRQDSGTSARLDVDRRVQRYKQARLSATVFSEGLKPLRPSGGFMGYCDVSTGATDSGATRTIPVGH
eukprot:m.380008 g.380008  ORF g.380008 m.380008 type:complete len:386 (-) comp28234_c0_seq4:278-1435(-)